MLRGSSQVARLPVEANYGMWKQAMLLFLDALTGLLRCCFSLVWLVTLLHSKRLALHPASLPKKGLSAIFLSLRRITFFRHLFKPCLKFSISTAVHAHL